MNLGGLFAGLNAGNRGGSGGLFGSNRTLLIALIVIIVIFGFGYGRGIFGGTGGAYSGYRGFGAYGTYGQVPPGGLPNPLDTRRKKHRSRHRKRDGGEYGFAYGANYGYGYPGYGSYGGYPSYGGGFFGNDWWFIIAIIALLFLIGEETEDNEGSSVNI